MGITPKECVTAWNVCMKMMENGLLAKPTHDDIIRFAPPLTITEEEIMDCARIIRESVLAFD
ncbi:hypothetical protein BH09BAC5_BH09BAC5_24310 [soil metagenome]